MDVEVAGVLEAVGATPAKAPEGAGAGAAAGVLVAVEDAIDPTVI